VAPRGPSRVSSRVALSSARSSPGSSRRESERRGAFGRRKRHLPSLRTRPPRSPTSPGGGGMETSSPRVRRGLSPSRPRVASPAEEPDARKSRRQNRLASRRVANQDASPSIRDPRRRARGLRGARRLRHLLQLRLTGAVPPAGGAFIAVERNPGHARAFAERLLHGGTRLAVRRRRRQKVRARPVEPLRLFLGRRRVRRVGREGTLTYEFVGNRRDEGR